jgi:hypothetical protein
MSRRAALLLPLAASITGLAAACGGAPSNRDFASKAQSFIEGDMAKNTQLNGLTFTDATCQKPANTAAGTQFTCTAMGSDGQQRTLTAKVLDRNSLQIVKLEPGPPQRGTTTTPGATTTTVAGAPAAPPPTTAAG